uniref:Uncharacterized protein LOC105055887 isoform X2 n=1 Tax=Elaeis guineensis var. tenera TaxID=51953 RepID=A0A8N4FCM3_ELAGV|nr:uncharacterized protein LOC105055887 isoform X2 [Elaeis guineensis]
MGMAVLMASPNPPVALRSKIETSQSQRTLAHYRASVSIGSHSRCHFLTHSVKIRAAEHFGEPKNVTDYLDDLVKSLWETSPRPLKEFPWKEAKYMILERLLFHGQKAFKWSIIVLLVVSVALTDFFREFLHEYFRSMKDESFKHLVGIGLFFVLIKLISLSFEVPGGYCFLILGMVA